MPQPVHRLESTLIAAYQESAGIFFSLDQQGSIAGKTGEVVLRKENSEDFLLSVIHS
jgi:hypothetical protein